MSSFHFKVTRAYPRGAESAFATFADFQDAKNFTQLKLLEDANLKVSVLYRIYDRSVLLEELDQSALGGSGSGQQSAGSSSTGSQGQGRGAGFHPTPFANTLRPPGVPHNWIVDDEDGTGEK